MERTRSRVKGKFCRLVILVVALSLAGCGMQPQSTPIVDKMDKPVAAPLTSPVQFTDSTALSGIKFVHNSGASAMRLMPETVGSGAAFLDYDGDDYQDIFFVNSRYWTQAEAEQFRKGKWSQDEMTIWKRNHLPTEVPVRSVPAHMPTQPTVGALYHNNGNGTFTDVTSGSGLGVPMFGMGVCVGDYDNDGKVDLYVTAIGRNTLFHNQGGGKFRDVSGPAGVQDAGWSTSAAWVDYDRDGKLDLYVCHYVAWSPGTDIYGTINGKDKSYTPPYLYGAELNHLFHNEGSGRFKDVSARSGIQRVPSTVKGEKGKNLPGRSLGVAICDTNNDEWPDLIVANDGDPNFLFRNNKNGTFTEIGEPSGIAYSQNGHTRAGMGIDTADINHTNQDSMAVGNFDNEMLGLYLNQGNGSFVDVAPLSAVGPASRLFSIFGVSFLDSDNDGWPDLLTSSGHISMQMEGVRGTHYALRPLLFHNDGKGNFKEIGEQSGTGMTQARVGRGLAIADFDLDGDDDVLFTVNGAAPVLCRNDGGNKNNSIRLILQGSKSNRSAIGTLVKVKFSEKDGLRRWVRSGSSYLSQSELPLTLGLGKRTKAPLITFHWPSGVVTQVRDVQANRIVTVDETRGIISNRPFPHH